jgi:hypothetical protein
MQNKEATEGTEKEVKRKKQKLDPLLLDQGSSARGQEKKNGFLLPQE